MGKISKSRGGGPMPPLEMIEQHSADAVRYWAASTGPGKDAIISEEKIQIGGKLVNKIWNVARFSSRFIEGDTPNLARNTLTPADHWLLSRTQRLIQRVTALFEDYDYAAAKAETETFFWHFADNYLELAKQRLYDDNHPQRAGAVFTLHHTLLTLLKLFAPILPHVTERIYKGIFATAENDSIHTSNWPVPDENLIDDEAEALGETIIEIAIAVRRFKSERNLSLGTELKRLQLATDNSSLRESLIHANADLMSITRAIDVKVSSPADLASESLFSTNGISIIVEI
jgi:valyl-tRNA synthetase